MGSGEWGGVVAELELSVAYLGRLFGCSGLEGVERPGG